MTTAAPLSLSDLLAEHTAEVIELDDLGPKIFGARVVLNDGRTLLFMPAARSAEEREWSIRGLLAAPLGEPGTAVSPDGRINWTHL